MNKIVAVVLLLIISTGLSAQVNDVEAIKKLLTTQRDAWNRGDVVAFMKGYWENDSLMFIGSSGITYGYKNTLENYKKSYPTPEAMGQLSFEFVSFKKLSDVFYRVVGKWHLKRTIGDAGGHYTLLFQKINGEWVITEDHSS
jgi:ketosteroid isomerase-like protein